MKLRKLIMGILLCIVILNLSAIQVYAAEGTDASQAITTGIQNGIASSQLITTDNQDGTTASQSVTTDIQEDTTTEQPVVTDDQEAEEAMANSEEAEETKEVAEPKAVNEKKPVVKAKTVKKAPEVKYSNADLRLLSALVYCEAQAESYNGKLAVAIVVMNRVRSNLFPNSVKGVIYQSYQFTPARNGALTRALAEYDNGKFNSTYEKACIKAAKAALSGERDITVNGKEKNFSKYLFFSRWLSGHTFSLQHHQFK